MEFTFCLVEVLLEAVPQIGLKLYICGYTNKIYVILTISILSSFVSMTLGMVNGCMASI
jgi:hypothetical protein